MVCTAKNEDLSAIKNHITVLDSKVLYAGTTKGQVIIDELGKFMRLVKVSILVIDSKITKNYQNFLLESIASLTWT